MNNFLSGIDDVPAVADTVCCDCGVTFTDENQSDWFVFVKVKGQMFQLPICDNCMAKRDSGPMIKSDE